MKIRNSPTAGTGWGRDGLRQEVRENRQGVSPHDREQEDGDDTQPDQGRMKLRTIVQAITIRGATPEDIFEVFTDSRKHSQLIGARVKTSRKAGAAFSAFDGFVTGRNLKIVPNRLLVQSWRGSVWKKQDLDSVLILHFSNVNGGTLIQMVHAGLPPAFEERWSELYWQPLTLRFAKRSP
jgi:uncharacterized protein YndB with AHSA1/START domain